MEPARSKALWAVAVLGTLMSILLLYPGQYPFDAAFQLWQARSGNYNDLSPVTMLLTWSVLLKAGAGPASLLLLNLIMIWCGWALCADALRVRIGWRIGILLITGGSPLMLVEMAHLLSDAHLAAVLVLVTGLLADQAARGGNGKIWIAVGLLIYAGAVRHNALIAIVPFGVIVASNIDVSGGALRRRAVIAVSGLVLASVSLGVLLDRIFVDQHATTWTAIAVWDLAAISVDSGELLIPNFAHGPGLSVAELVETKAFDPVSNIYLYTRSRSGVAAGLVSPFSAAQQSELRHQWWQSVRDHPVAYLRHRFRTFALLIGIPIGESSAVPYLQDRYRYRDDPELPEPLAAEHQRQLYKIVGQRLDAWWMRALPSLALLAIAFIAGWRRRDDAVARVGWMASCSALLYASTFLLLAPGAELRYLTWILAIAPMTLALVLFGNRRALGFKSVADEPKPLAR